MKCCVSFIVLFLREDLALSLSSAQEEAGRREKEWEEEGERREAEVQGLNQHVKQLQSSLATSQQEKAQVCTLCTMCTAALSRCRVLCTMYMYVHSCLIHIVYCVHVCTQLSNTYSVLCICTQLCCRIHSVRTVYMYMAMRLVTPHVRIAQSYIVIIDTLYFV